jgi:hypothetical protein
MKRHPRRPTVEKRILEPARVRRIPNGFSWIDRRIVRDGWLERLARDEILLYFFLVTVADRHGLSFYSDRTIESLLKLPDDALERARSGLLGHDLIAYQPPLYQVLALGHGPVPRRQGELVRLAEVLRRILPPKAGGEEEGVDDR